MIPTMPKATYVIDGNAFDDLDGFYEEISNRLIPGADWGRNLDAFNDILYGGFGTPEDGFRLVWKNSARSRQTLGHPETARRLRQRLERCHPDNRDTVRRLIELVDRGEGPTVFDWLTDIIQSNADIKLVLE